MNKKGEIIDEIPAETLQSQYSEMWSQPSELYKIENPSVFFENPDSEDKPKLCNIIFTKKNLMKNIKN